MGRRSEGGKFEFAVQVMREGVQQHAQEEAMKRREWQELQGLMEEAHEAGNWHVGEEYQEQFCERWRVREEKRRNTMEERIRAWPDYLPPIGR